MAEANAWHLRRLSSAEAFDGRARLQAIFRDAVLGAGPTHYRPEQCAVWASTADDEARWTPWLRDGSTWVASPREQDLPIGVGMTCPSDHVHLLYVDPRFHRRGVARRLLQALEGEARRRGIAALTTAASLISHPVFEAAGYEVVEWEDAPHGGQVFRRARMRKVLS